MEDFVNLGTGNPALALRWQAWHRVWGQSHPVSRGDREVSLRVCLVDSNHDDLLRKEPVGHAEWFLWPGHEHPFGFARKLTERFSMGARALPFGRGAQHRWNLGTYVNVMSLLNKY